MDTGILSLTTQQLPASGLNIRLNKVPAMIMVTYLLFFALLVTACCLAITQPGWCLGTILLIGVYARLLFSKHLCRTHPRGIKQLVFTELGWCYVQFNDENLIKADIERDSIVSEHLVILNLKERSESSAIVSFFYRHSLVLTANELGHMKFRQLKRHLRLINCAKKMNCE